MADGIDKAEAAKYGAAVSTVGNAVQLVTNGMKVSEYRPAESDKPVDIIVRFPPERRSLDQIDELRVNLNGGSVPIGNFVKREPAPRVERDIELGKKIGVSGTPTFYFEGRRFTGQASTSLLRDLTK